MSKKFILPIIALLVGLTAGLFLGMEYKAYQVRTALQQAFETPFEAEQKQSIVGQAEEEKSEIIERNIGDEVELATLKFKVNKVEEKQTLSSGYGTPKVAKEDAKFVVIDLNITNTTDTKFTFFPDDGFRLVDNKKREYTTYPDSIGAVSNYLNVQDLSPSITENGVLVYEMPNDAENYSLLVAKAGTNQVYKIVLK